MSGTRRVGTRTGERRALHSGIRLKHYEPGRNIILGTPQEARWSRATRRDVPATSSLERLLRKSLGPCRLLDAQPLTEGFRNTNLCVRLDVNPGRVVVKFFEHDVSLYHKEIDLIRLAGSLVPVAEVICAEPNGWEDLPPYLVMRYVEGITFRALKQRGDRAAMDQALVSTGGALAAISRVTFPAAGWLAPGPSVALVESETADPIPRFVDCCLASVHLLFSASHSDLKVSAS